jgi:hypothetical protein
MAVRFHKLAGSLRPHMNVYTQPKADHKVACAFTVCIKGVPPCFSSNPFARLKRQHDRHPALSLALSLCHELKLECRGRTPESSNSVPLSQACTVGPPALWM